MRDVADQRHRQVEPAAHAAGVGRGQLPGRLGQVEPLEQFVRTPVALGLGQVVQVGHEEQVLPGR